MAIDIKVLQRLAQAATPGQWTWRQNHAGRIDLAAPHGGGTVVMDFVRQGMQAGQPRFAISLDDPTIRRCKSFAKAWDCDGLVVANLYALRATNPADLWKAADPVGPENDTHLRILAAQHETVVCAWGANARPDRVKAVREIFSGRMHRLMCLGTTKDGAPRHPLYIASSTKLVPWGAQSPDAGKEAGS